MFFKLKKFECNRVLLIYNFEVNIFMMVLFLLFVTLEASKLSCSRALRRFQRDNWSGYIIPKYISNKKN